MTEALISYETAVLLKEKGYNYYSKFSYWNGELINMTPGYVLETGETSQDNYFEFSRFYAPTQSLVQKWLREKCKLHIIIDCVVNSEDYRVAVFEIYGGIYHNIDMRGTYEEVLEAGLQKALNLIILFASYLLYNCIISVFSKKVLLSI